MTLQQADLEREFDGLVREYDAYLSRVPPSRASSLWRGFLHLLGKSPSLQRHPLYSKDLSSEEMDAVAHALDFIHVERSLEAIVKGEVDDAPFTPTEVKMTKVYARSVYNEFKDRYVSLRIQRSSSEYSEKN